LRPAARPISSSTQQELPLRRFGPNLPKTRPKSRCERCSLSSRAPSCAIEPRSMRVFCHSEDGGAEYRFVILWIGSRSSPPLPRERGDDVSAPHPEIEL
jgi:hypothetical protein